MEPFSYLVEPVPPALLYLMAVVLFPERMEEGADLERHYFDGRRAFFLLFVLAVVSGPLVSAFLGAGLAGGG